MNKFLKYFLVSFITAVLTLSLSTKANKSDITVPTDQTQYQLFKKIVDITKKNYVEEIESDKLFYSAFDGMLRSLDPHSGFLNTDEYKEMNVQTSGKFGGVGIEITMDRGLLKVISPIDGTPAEKAGIKPSDYITMIDGQSVRDFNINQAVEKIRGLEGSKVKLTVIREGASEPLEFTLTRAVIKIVSIRSKIIDDNIAYFRITAFSRNTALNLESQYKKIKAKLNNKIQGIVLDLRNNPGGLLPESIAVSELFIDGGVIVSTKGRNRSATEVFNAALGDITANTPIVVLINQGSASASEIVAGALQDHKRALILGTKSFGKGSVQTVMPLNKERTLGMRLTTSRYYTPSGRSIQAQGIEPDIYIAQSKLDTAETKYLSESNLPGHLKTTENNKKTIKNSKKSITKLYSEDYQLARAVDLLHAIFILKK